MLHTWTNELTLKFVYRVLYWQLSQELTCTLPKILQRPGGRWASYKSTGTWKQKISSTIESMNSQTCLLTLMILFIDMNYFGVHTNKKECKMSHFALKFGFSYETRLHMLPAFHVDSA